MQCGQHRQAPNKKALGDFSQGLLLFYSAPTRGKILVVGVISRGHQRVAVAKRQFTANPIAATSMALWGVLARSQPVPRLDFPTVWG